MLHPKINRLDYGKLLMPPEGYKLTRAITTSYSLDIEALMLMPIALFYSESIDREKGELRFDMLDSIIKATDKITIYCQEGKIKVPKKYHFLMAFWEQRIKQVRMPIAEASFHPKIWVIRFDADGEPAYYKFIITSKNLTFSFDYDIVFSTEGTVNYDQKKNLNTPVIDFLNYLNNIDNSIDKEFIEDLKKVKFNIPPKFSNLDFFPIGINDSNNKPYTNPIGEYEWSDLLAISPFVDETTVKKLRSITKNNLWICGLRNELSMLSESAKSEVELFQFSEQIESNSMLQDFTEGDDDPLPQSLHAKAYFTNYDGVPYWYLGSANFTSPAFGRNVEFLIELECEASGLTPKTVLKQLTEQDNKNNIPIFETFVQLEDDSAAERKKFELELRKLLYNVLGSKASGFVNDEVGNDLYSLTLDIDFTTTNWSKDFELVINPISKTNENKNLTPLIKDQVVFNQLFSITQLSPYFILSIFHKNSTEPVCNVLWEVAIKNMPSSRLDKVFSSIIDSRDKFMQYLHFLLNETGSDIIEGGDKNDRGSSGIESNNFLFDGKPIFESLLLAASRDLDKLKQIDVIINKLSQEEKDETKKIVSEEFFQLWQVFKEFLKGEA